MSKFTQLDLFQSPKVKINFNKQGITAVSVRNPWAYAIFNGKDIENRDWAIAPGLLVIQAAKTFNRREFDDAVVFCARMNLVIPPPTDLVWMAAIGVVEVTKVVDNRGSHDFQGWGMPCQQHWHLTNQKLFKTPIPMPGRLGPFNSGLSLQEVNELCN